MTSPSTLNAQTVPEYLDDDKTHRRLMARAIRSLNNGHMNCTLDVTLRASQTTTTINDTRLSATTAIVPAMPMTSNAATALKNGIYVDTVTTQVGTTPASAVIHHASNAATDQTIRFLIIG